MNYIIFLVGLFLTNFLSVSSFSLGDLFHQVKENKITCRNELTGEELDWFTAYKLPKSSSELYADIENDSGSRGDITESNDYRSLGTAYALMTNKQQSWSYSTLSFNDSKSIAGQTLAPLYASSSSNDNEIGYILYNDQADKVTLIKGHTKGVIIFNADTAVWVVHSVPNFPPKKSVGEYLIHPSQCVYGQSMLCMTFKFDDLDKIGLQLLYNYPQVYDFNIPERILKGPKGSVLDNLMKVVDGQHVTAQPYSNVLSLTTLGGEQMLSFAKTSDFEQDLYAGLVAPKIQSNLLTETWNNAIAYSEVGRSSNRDYL